ncbi:MAG: hypothetical protein IPK26_12850 [Planctomycetes bacterium]|nr:hypothetical protein [Planctomycetota bacterium]
MGTTHFACAAFLLSSLAVGQTPPCLAFNDANTNVNANIVTSYGFGGQNSLAWQITPQTTLAVLAAQIYTRNTALTGDRFMMLEIWSDNNGLPGSRITGGAWRIVNARPFAWQGTDFDGVAVLNANTPYWVVWVEPGFSNPPLETGGFDVLPKTQRTGTGAWGAVTNESPKIRLFCNQFDSPHMSMYGPFCFTSGGSLPSVFSNEDPAIGNATFLLETSGSPSGVPVFVALGLDPTYVSNWPGLTPPGCFQNTDIVEALLLTSGTGNSRGPTCASHASVTLAIPADNALIGLTLAAQSVPFDAGAMAPLPFATSSAARFVLF